MRAKTIDRLELTKQKFGKKTVAQSILKGLEEACECTHKQGYSMCPQCGEETLRHEGACNICPNCGYSKCG